MTTVIIWTGGFALILTVIAFWPTLRLFLQPAQHKSAVAVVIANACISYVVAISSSYEAVISEYFKHQNLAVWLTILTISIFSLKALSSNLSEQMLTSQEARSLAETNSKLQKLALYDALTNLPNRILLEQKLDQAKNKAMAEKGEFSVMVMDLDGFKAVNDTWGHYIGDKLLIAITKRITDLIPRDCTLARLGGDEFVLVMDADEKETVAMASELVEKVSLPYNVHNYDLKISLSIGITRYPNDGVDINVLLLNADTAMYQTKNKGGNCWMFFDHTMAAQMEQRQRINEDLQLAIERNELCLFYQPKFTLPKGPIEGFEALLRWQHPTYGLLEPAQFLPYAEKKGLIVTIGYWVINEACRQLRCWHLQGYTNWSVAVNLSALQFIQRDLRAKVAAALERHQILPERLTLEVTETTAMCDPSSSERIINDLCELGVQVAIDEYGVSYRNLLHLYRFPASELKVDRRFIRQMLEGTGSTKDVRTLARFAQMLKVRLVAVGVETCEQRHLLAELGFTTLQGYLLGRPMPGDKVLCEELNGMSAQGNS